MAMNFAAHNEVHASYANGQCTTWIDWTGGGQSVQHLGNISESMCHAAVTVLQFCVGDPDGSWHPGQPGYGPKS